MEIFSPNSNIISYKHYMKALCMCLSLEFAIILFTSFSFLPKNFTRLKFYTDV